MGLQWVRKWSVGDDRNILDDRNPVDVLSNNLARVTMKSHLGLVKWLQDMITGLCVRNSFTAETVSHLDLVEVFFSVILSSDIWSIKI